MSLQIILPNQSLNYMHIMDMTKSELYYHIILRIDGYGQIFSCVDINKQPAFDHPLLMNHKIQMGPGSLPKVIKDKKASSLGVSLKVGLKDGGCPLGTVPIRRITKEELKRAKSSPNIGKGYPSNAQDPSNDEGKFRFELQSTYKDGGAEFGSWAVLNTWQPKITGNQSSGSLVILRDESPPEQTRSIHAGWLVSFPIPPSIIVRYVLYKKTELSIECNRGLTKCHNSKIGQGAILA
ncbi:protein neprosin-like [Tasmannia lanceolata]|uniref:protein neprosin-like n=1 Tax=Tasmannia lanceolata TaxID=3420 RepID=UPI0040636F3F